MFNMLLGCITPGGVGSGLYGIVVVAVLSVFVAGLMVGRTPEYLGKKIEAREMKFVMFALLIYTVNVLGFAAASAIAPFVQDDLGNKGPHGLSEIIYAFASTNGNNGSAFAGLNGNNLWFNTTLGLRHVSRALRLCRAGAGARRLARRRRRRWRLRPALSRRQARSSSACCSA